VRSACAKPEYTLVRRLGVDSGGRSVPSPSVSCLARVGGWVAIRPPCLPACLPPPASQPASQPAASVRLLAQGGPQAPQPRPSRAALALVEPLVPQPALARAEPRQHDLSLGTAVKICTNTDLPRTQPGDTAARQRERETCRVGTDHASYCQQCPRNPEVVGHPGTHDGRA
jgi:hypothetical protein